MTTRQSLIIPSLLLVSAFLLAACLPDLNTQAPDRPDLPRTHLLADGAIVVSAPNKFCVDKNAGASDRFVLLTNCDVLAGLPKSNPSNRGVLTVSSGPVLAESERNISLLNAFGQNTIVSKRVTGLVMQQMGDDGAPRLPGAAASHWRGILKVNNRIVSLAVYGPQEGRVLGTEGRRLLENLAARIQQSSPAQVSSEDDPE